MDNFVGHFHLEIAREALVSINAIVAEGNEWKAAFIVVLVYLPNNAAESFQTTMKHVFALIWNQLVVHPTIGELCTSNPVSYSPNNGSKVRCVIHVFLDCFIPKNYIRQLSIFVRENDRHDGGAIVGELNGEIALVEFVNSNLVFITCSSSVVMRMATNIPKI
uniref:Uncharacterized protein n=1 Tax=Opuntia streptacantha TaxID=393608 RepID=A0A7C8YZF6_OPUST